MTDAAAAEAPQKKSMLPWILLGCGCLGLPLIGVLLFVFVIGAGVAAVAGIMMAAPEGARLHVELAQTDPAAAYEDCSEEYKTVNTLEEFTAFVEANPALYNSADLSFSNTAINNNRATLTGTATGPEGEVGVTFTMINLGDISEGNAEDWNVVDITIH